MADQVKKGSEENKADEIPKPASIKISPRISGDGKRIYFEISRGGDKLAEIWVSKERKEEKNGEEITVVKAKLIPSSALKDLIEETAKPVECRIKRDEDLSQRIEKCFEGMGEVFEGIAGKDVYIDGKIESGRKALTTFIVKTAANWERYLDDIKGVMRERVREAGGKGEDLNSEPVFEDEINGRKIRILALDGTHINAHGDFIDLGDYLVISESTFAYTEINTEDGTFESIDPVGIAIIYKRDQGSIAIADKKIYYLRFNNKIAIGDRIIRLRGDIKDVKADLIYSFPDIITFKKILDGEEIKRTWVDVGDEIIAKLKDYIVLDDERIYDVIASYIVMTYFYDVFTAVPLLYFHGPAGSGKTRANITTTYMCRRGIFVADPSDATLYRMIDALKPVTGIDESMLSEKAKRIIAAGYKKGAAVPRAEPSSRGIALRFFDTVAPRVFSFEHPPSSDYLLQRCILINMLKAKPRKTFDPLPDEFKGIREILYYLRLTKLPDILDARDKAFKILDEKGVWGRDAEIWAPILAAAILIGREKNVLDYVVEDVNRRRIDEALYDEEKIVLAAVDELFSKTISLTAEGGKVITFMSKDLQKIIKNQILDSEGCLEIEPDGYVKGVKIEPRCVKLEQEIERKWKTQKVGIVLRNLGFEKYKKKKGKGSGARYVYEISYSDFINIAKKYDYESKGEVEKKDEAGGNDQVGNV
ncbi:MAG: hypothetical protein RQ885_04570 [Desulfurococcales archaeon]|jgi:hypothetical protein|nr:hypothetical protein [Desulfurococcales archaeon]